MYYYVYVLLSEKDGKFYTGYTVDLKARLKLHNEGKVYSTKNRWPLKLIYFEGCINQQDAIGLPNTAPYWVCCYAGRRINPHPFVRYQQRFPLTEFY